jgi:hypothetical protein
MESSMMESIGDGVCWDDLKETQLRVEGMQGMVVLGDSCL